MLKNVTSQIESSRPVPTKKYPKSHREPWFDDELKNLKSELSKLSRWLCKFPYNQTLKHRLFERKREYRLKIRAKKQKFIKLINQTIEDEECISWSNLQGLKNFQETRNDLDVYDMVKFIEFFTTLYQTKPLPASTLHKFDVRCTAEDELEFELNKLVEAEELKEAVTKLKTGKAVSDDGILNEFLINVNPALLKVILKIFNSCLIHGCYPWNTSIITPLHKKGNRYDPNNYRAIAVGSNLGKLFASILLNRLLKFRADNAPNPPNQQTAQTMDHVLCLDTCIHKYAVKKKNYLFACIVDYSKAFDTVCREALIYKLYHMGARGRFLRCLQHMYTSSEAKIKLLGRLSKKIDIHVSTEQGHPLSPELFKIYINDLSNSLNNINGIEVPSLNGKDVSALGRRPSPPGT